MSTFGLLLLIAILFYFLGRAADLVVNNLKVMAGHLGIEVSFLGFILGFFTSFPELAIAVNSSLSGVPTISFGNLIGGIPVLLGLVLGLNIIFARSVSTHGARRPLLGILAVLFLPLLLALDGTLGVYDGAILVILYLALMIAFYVMGKNGLGFHFRIFFDGKIAKPIFLMLGGGIAVLLLSNLIIRFTMELLGTFAISGFAIGLLFFAIGTNLPEIIISFRAWRNHNEELSLSNLFGSAVANICILGFVALAVTIPVAVTPSFYVLIVFMALLLAAVLLFYRSGRRFSRTEGVFLLAIYIAMIATEVFGFILE